MLDKIFGKEGRHIAFGIVVLTILVALFLISFVAGFVSIQLVCYSFMAAAFVEAMAIPRLSPIKTTKYDEATPVTSYILGNRTTSLSMSYLFIEIIVAAVMVHFNMERITLAFYVQAAMMIAYLSLIGFVTSHPGKSEERRDIAKETPEDVTPAKSGDRHADDSKPVSHERVGEFLKGLHAALANTQDPEVRKQINKLIEALKKCPPDSYESMNEVDTQIMALIGELGERVKANENDIAKECVMLVMVLSNQRTALYNKIVKQNRQARKEQKKAGKKG